MTPLRVAVYTRKSTDAGLERAFNSLDAQREAVEAYVRSQKGEGWVLVEHAYDDGGYTGANIDRPAFSRLIADVEDGHIDIVAVYKIDRLSRSLADFARIIERFDRNRVSFVSVTQQFNTASSMGRLTLNILMSFAEFEREVIAERTRDKIRAMRQRGEWTGSKPVLGYDVHDKKLIVNEVEADLVRAIFERFLVLESIGALAREADERGWRTKKYVSSRGKEHGGQRWTKPNLRNLLTQPLYVGEVRTGKTTVPGVHQPIVERDVWEAAQQLFLKGPTRRMRSSWSASLAGLLVCQQCGARWVHHTTQKGARRYRYYVCQSQLKLGAKVCPGSRVSAPQIEQFVLAQIRAIGRDSDLSEQVGRELEKQDRAHRKQAARQGQRQERKRLRSERSHLIDAIAQAGPHSGLLERLGRVDLELEASEQAHRSVSVKNCEELAPGGEAWDALRRFDPIWEQLTVDEQGRLLTELLECVLYCGQTREVEFVFREGWSRILSCTTEKGESS